MDPKTNDEEYVQMECSKCQIKFWIPKALDDVAKIREAELNFYCPNGHGQHYITIKKK